MLRTALLLALATCSFAPPAHADLLGQVNAIRRNGCGQHGGLKPLQHNAQLDLAAQQWSKAGTLADALKRVDYPLSRSSSMHLSGPVEDAAVARMLKESYCNTLVVGEFTDIGVFQRDRDTWVVVGARFTPANPGNPEQTAQKVLALVNAARAEARNCGERHFDSAPALQLAEPLNQAARVQAQNMMEHHFLEHRGSDGSSISDRVTRTGYSWQRVGENIASGVRTAEELVSEWLDSPSHCANIMAPQFKEMGIAYAVNPKGAVGIYWSQVFATPRQAQ